MPSQQPEKMEGHVASGMVLPDLLPIAITNVIERQRRGDGSLLVDVSLGIFLSLSLYRLGRAAIGGFR